MTKYEMLDLPLNLIVPSEDNPREEFDENELKALAGNIKEHGLLEEISVRKVGDKFEIVDGERRWRAVTILGWDIIRAKVYGITAFEAQNIRLSVLFMRKGVKDASLEKRIYAQYKAGRANGEFKGGCEKDKGYEAMTKATGIAPTVIKQYVTAAQEREDHRSMDFPEEATHIDLFETRALEKDAPAARDELLKQRVEKKATVSDIRQRIKAIKDVPEELILPIAKGEITPETARKLADVKDPQMREQLIAERLAIKEELTLEEEEHDKEIEEVKVGKQKTARQIKADVSMLEHNNVIESNLYDLHVDALAGIRADHINSVTDLHQRARCWEYVRRIQVLCDRALSQAHHTIEAEIVGEGYVQ
jgi:ParB-like chromosome segregation protein Spo0J